MNTKRILAIVLVTLALTTTLAGAPVLVGYEVEGDQLVVTLSNSGSAPATARVIAFQSGQIIGSETVTVDAASIENVQYGINDDLNPFFQVAIVAAPD